MYVADHSAYPETIDPAWFASQKLTNPFDPNHANPIFVAIHPTHAFPRFKTLVSGSAFWYNKDNGAFSARVPAQDSDAETINLFNRVNDSDITTLDQRR